MRPGILCKRLYIFFALYFIFSADIHLHAQNNCVQFDIIGGNAPKGDCIWVPVRVYNFDTILSAQFALSYDPQVIMPVDKWATTKLVGLDPNTNINFDTIRKIVRFLWANPNSDCDGLIDGDTLIMIKFKLIGEPGSCTKVSFFDRSPVPTEVLDCNADEYCVEEINIPDNDICIGEPTSLCVLSYSCGTVTNSGSITIKPFGGTSPYIVDRIAPPQSDTLAKSGDCVVYNNLFPGTYEIHVKDATGKDTILMVVVGMGTPIAIFPNGIRQPTCWNTCDGEINIRITGGVGNMTIGWRPTGDFGLTTLRRLCVGDYTVTVRDSAGCLATETFKLFADTITSQVEILKDASCTDDGAAVARAFGGNPYPGGLYDYFWSQNVAANTSDTTSYNFRLSGQQFVIIQDSRGCMDTVFFDIPYGGVLLDSIVIDSIDCFGDSTGIIHSFVRSNGTLNIPLAFRLTDQNNNTIFGGVNGVDRYTSPLLKAGTYFLEITDTSGCKRFDTIVLTQPNLLEIIENDVDTTASCSPGNDAYIDIRGFGGTPGYQFNWSHMAMGGRVTNLSQGVYTVTLTDANGCSLTREYTITQPFPPNIDSIITFGPNCSGDTTGSANLFFTPGSHPNVNFRWSTGDITRNLINIRDGSYSVTITDGNGCVDSASVNILPQGNALRVASAVTRDPRCNGNSDGFIVINIAGGQGPYTYLWDNGVQTPNNTNLKAGRHCVRIDDFGNCPPLDTCFTLSEPPAIGINISTISAPSCSTPGTCDATAIVTTACTDTFVSLTWSSGEQVFRNRDTANLLCSGQQFVIATCGFCADTVLFDVPEAVPITIDSNFLSITAPRCYNSNDGQISIRAKGGTGPYQYNWINPAISAPTISNLGDGMYYVNIVDSKNCVHLDSVRLRQPDSIRVDIIAGSTLDVSCPGSQDGRISTAWTGGNGGKGSFRWSPVNSQDSIVTNLAAGTYFLTVTDSKNCTGTVSYTVSEPPPIQFVMSPPDTPRCVDDQVLFSIIQASGGSGATYRFTINNGAPVNIGQQVPLFPGNYAVRVYDKNNCFKDTSIIVSNPTNLINLNFGRDFDTIQLGDSILLDGNLLNSGVIDTIIWSPSNSVSNPGSTISFVSPGRTTLYTLTVIDEDGCQVSDQITIVVRSTRRFYAPNVFSPNGDNINDAFEVFMGPGIEAIKYARIFDRWGNMVSSIENPPRNGERMSIWNGRFGNNGDLMNPGVYVYVAEVVFQDGSTTVYRGDITLLR
ncbi:MAG: gliding motility-associated C-terminal domain-containing protein [Saprospiraceae bacterium]|nr:gliding motility-associated C-terminal domain-containing protein [Saprospiraceae bacterium]